MVYEVLRSYKGRPVFLDDHIDRMQRTVTQSGADAIPGPEEIRRIVFGLVRANGPEEGNILLCQFEIARERHFLACFIEHHYPSPGYYEEGVYLQTLNAMRPNPNAKVFNPALRKKTEFLKSSREVAEMLLVDKHGCITEGSRSNIFMIRGGTLYTPPSAKVLLGITRQKVIDICRETGIPVVEADIPLKEIAFYEAAFITGTSPKVLPVKYIDECRFNAGNTLMRKIMLEFDRLMQGDSLS